MGGKLETMDIVKYMLLKEMANTAKECQRYTLYIRSQKDCSFDSLCEDPKEAERLSRLFATTNREIAKVKRAANALCNAKEHKKKKPKELASQSSQSRSSETSRTEENHPQESEPKKNNRNSK